MRLPKSRRDKRTKKMVLLKAFFRTIGPMSGIPSSYFAYLFDRQKVSCIFGHSSRLLPSLQRVLQEQKE